MAIKKIYVALSGDDNASGSSEASPVKTLSKVSSMLATAATGDSVYVYLKGGESFTGSIQETGNSHYSVFINTYDSASNQYATVDNSTSPTASVISFHNKNQVIINNLKIIQASGSTCVGSRGIQVTCTAAYAGSNDRSQLRVTDCELTGADYGIRTQNCQTDINSVVIRYAWTRGLSIEAQTPQARGRTSGGDTANDRFIFRTAGVHIENVGVSGPAPGGTTNASTTDLATGLYITGYVFSTATPSSGTPSNIYTLKVIDCKYGIVIVSPDAGTTAADGVFLLFNRCFIKSHSNSVGALLKVSKDTGATRGANIRFLNCIFSLLGDVSESAALLVNGHQLDFWNNTVVTRLATNTKYMLYMQTSFNSAHNNIFKNVFEASGQSVLFLQLAAGSSLSADFNSYVRAIDGAVFKIGTVAKTFAQWQSSVGDAQSLWVYNATIMDPFFSSAFSNPEDFRINPSSVGFSASIIQGGNQSAAAGLYNGSRLTDYFGYERSVTSGYWDKGAIEVVDVNRQNPLTVSDGLLKFSSVPGLLPNHGVETFASLPQTPPSLDIFTRPHFVEAYVQSTAGVKSIGIWGLGGRAGINGFSSVPLQYADSLPSNFTVPRPFIATILARPYRYSPGSQVGAVTYSDWEIGNTPGLNDDRRVMFTLERPLSGAAQQIPTLKIKLVNEGETLINLLVTGAPIQAIYNTLIKLRLEIRYTGTRVYNNYTGLLDYEYDFKCFVNNNEVISSPNVVMPKEWVEGTNLQYGTGPAIWAGIVGTSYSPNTASISNMGWGDFTSGLGTSFVALNQTSARNKFYLADLDASLNRISNGGFTRYPKQQKSVVTKVRSVPGYLTPESSAVTRAAVHVVLAVQTGYNLFTNTGFSTVEYLDRVKKILRSFIESLSTQSYSNKVIVTILGYFGASVASKPPYDDTLGKCKILSPRLGASYSVGVDYFSPFSPGNAKQQTPLIALATAEQGLRQNSRMKSVVAANRSGRLLNADNKDLFLQEIEGIQSDGAASGPLFVGPVASRCFESGGVTKSSSGFKQIQGEKKLVFFICDNKGPIPYDVLYNQGYLIGYYHDKNNNRRRSQIIQAMAEFKNIGVSRSGVVVAGDIESPGTPSPGPTYTLRESLRGWVDVLSARNATGADAFINTPRSTVSLSVDAYLRSQYTLGLPATATNPWLGPFMLNLSGLVTPTTYSNLGAFAGSVFPFVTAADKDAAAAQVGVDLAAEVKRWCDVVITPQAPVVQQISADNPVVSGELDEDSGLVFSVPDSENVESPITPWQAYGSEGLFEIIPVDGDVTHYSPDGGNQARITLVKSGVIYLKQKLSDVKPLRGHNISVSFTLRKFTGSPIVSTFVIVDAQATQLGTESSAYAGECSRFSYNFKVPVSAKEVELMFEFSGAAAESAGIAAISLAVGSVSGARPFTECDSDMHIPSGTVIMTVGSSCPPGYVRVPDTTGRLAIGTTDNPALYERKIENVSDSNQTVDPNFRYIDVVLVLDMGGSYPFYRAINKMLPMLSRWPSNVVRFKVIHTNSLIPNQMEVFQEITPQTQLTIPAGGGLSRLSEALERASDELLALPSFSRKIVLYTVSTYSEDVPSITSAFNRMFELLIANISDISILALSQSAVPAQERGYSGLVYPSDSAVPPGAVYPIFGGAPGPLPLNSYTINDPSLGDYAASIIDSIINRQLRAIRLSEFGGETVFNALGGQRYHDHTSDTIQDPDIVTAGPSIFDSDGFEPPIEDVASGLEVLTNTAGVVPKKDQAAIKPYPFGKYADKGNPEDEPVSAIGPTHIHSVQTDMIAMPPAFQVIFCRRV